MLRPMVNSLGKQGGCFHKLGILLVDVLIVRASLFGVYIGRKKFCYSLWTLIVGIIDDTSVTVPYSWYDEITPLPRNIPTFSQEYLHNGSLSPSRHQLALKSSCAPKTCCARHWVAVRELS